MGANELKEMELAVSRWGNSLAVRLPVALARELGITEGSTLHVARDGENNLRLSAGRKRQPLTKQEWISRAREHLASMPRTESVIREMRDGARY